MVLHLLRFKLHYKTSSGEELRLVGSLGQLGRWDFQKVWMHALVMCFVRCAVVRVVSFCLFEEFAQVHTGERSSPQIQPRRNAWDGEKVTIGQLKSNSQVGFTTFSFLYSRTAPNENKTHACSLWRILQKYTRKRRGHVTNHVRDHRIVFTKPTTKGTSVPFEYKYLVYNHVTGEVQWEPTPNRIMEFPGSEGPDELDFEVGDKWVDWWFIASTSNPIVTLHFAGGNIQSLLRETSTQDLPGPRADKRWLC